MATHDIVLIGASAGGVEAISAIVAGFPRDLKAAVFVVLHVSRGRSVLPEILTRAGRLPATHPGDGERIEYGKVYVAPPDHHMIIEGDVIRITHGPSENGVRPAVDPLFRSAARAVGPRVVAVVATGSLDDGTAGMAAVKEAGGIAIVQDPDEAFSPSMPRSVMAAVAVDHVLPVGEIAPMIVALVREEASAAPRRGTHVVAMEPDRGPEQLALGGEDRPRRFRCSRARNAAARSGNRRSRQTFSDSGAASVTCIPRRACWRRRSTPSTGRCGRRCVPSKSGPYSHGSSPRAPASVSTAGWRTHSSSAPSPPKIRRPSSSACWWTGRRRTSSPITLGMDRWKLKTAGRKSD